MTTGPTAISDSTFYGMLSDTERQRLQDAGRMRTYPADSIMAMEGEPATSVVVLRQGWATASWVTAFGTESLLRIYGPGDITSAEAVLAQPVRQETVKAQTICDALLISASQFDVLYSTPGIARAFGLAMARRAQAADDKAKKIQLVSGASRLANILIELAERTGVQDADGSVTILVPLSQEELAGLAATSRATVARAVSEWRRRNLIRTGYREVVIIDIRRLRTIAAAISQLEVPEAECAFRHLTQGQSLVARPQSAGSTPHFVPPVPPRRAPDPGDRSGATFAGTTKRPALRPCLTWFLAVRIFGTRPPYELRLVRKFSFSQEKTRRLLICDARHSQNVAH